MKFLKPRTNKDKAATGFVIILLVLTAYVWLAPGGITRAPDLTLTLLDSSKLSLASLKGRPVLVTFWATTCPGCIKEMPHLIELYHKLHSKGLEIIGIAMPYDRPDHVNEMIKRKQVPYKIAFDNQAMAVQAFGNVKLTPTSFLINPNGFIVKQKIGEMDMHALQAQIEAMLIKG